MRTLSADQSALFSNANDLSTFARVRIQNAVGTYVDYTTFEGFNWLSSIDLTSNIDDAVVGATVVLKRDQEDAPNMSLAPLVTGSVANNLAGTYQPVIDSGRAIAIDVAVLPLGASPSSGDWQQIFDGKIDSFDPAAGGENANELELVCRDLAADLQDTMLEQEGRPNGTAYGDSGGLPGAGTPCETIGQQILSDWAPGAWTLYTPNGTLATPINPGDVAGFNVTHFKPNKESVLDALKALFNGIGYDVRYRYSSITGGFRLEVFNPARSKSVPDTTVAASRVWHLRQAKTDRTGVRNVVVVGYQTDPHDDTTRATVTQTDATSIGKYGRRYMEVTEAASSPINTSGEATSMASAILSDLKDPKTDMQVDLDLSWFLELGDLLGFLPGTNSAGKRYFDSQQNLAIVAFRHSFGSQGAITTIDVRGTPAGLYETWLKLQGRPGWGPWGRTFVPSLTAAASATVGGGILRGPDSRVNKQLLHYEYHLSTTSGFTPSSGTLVGISKSSRLEVTGLTAGTTYYFKLIEVRAGGIKGATSAQQSFVAGTLGVSLIGFALGDVPDGSGFNKVAGVTAGHGITGASFDTTNPIDLSPLASTGIKSAGVPIHLGGAILAGGALLPYSYLFDVANTNFILNPSFETNTNSWSVFDTAGVTTLARETGAGNFCVGVASCKVVTPATAGTHGIRHVNIAALPGESWGASAWVSNGVTNGFVRLEFLSAALAVLQTTDSTKLSGTGVAQDLNFFTRIGTSATAPASTAWVRVSILTTDVSTTFYVDGVQAEKATGGISTYTDGSMGTGYSWSGTPHASTSSRLAGFHILKPNSAFPFYLDTIGTPHSLGMIVRSSSAGEPTSADLNITVGDNALIAAEPCSMPTAPNPGSIDLCLAAGGPKGRVVIGAVAAGAGGIHIVGGGTSFPSTPSANDIYFRTDLGGLFKWDGSQWNPCNAGPRMELQKSGATKNQNLGTAPVRIYWDTTNLNIGGTLSDPGAQGGNSRWQPGIPGTYLCQFSCGINNNSAINEGCILSFRVNGSDAYVDQRYWPPSTSNLNVCLVAAIRIANATDYIECWAADSGGVGVTSTLLWTGTGGGNHSIFSAYLMTPNV